MFHHLPTHGRTLFQKLFGYATHSEKLPSITPHTFRHTFITRMYNSGMRAKSLQNLAGHGDIQTTLGIYTHSSYEQMEQEFKRIASV